MERTQQYAIIIIDYSFVFVFFFFTFLCPFRYFDISIFFFFLRFIFYNGRITGVAPVHVVERKRRSVLNFNNIIIWSQSSLSDTPSAIIVHFPSR